MCSDRNLAARLGYLSRTTKPAGRGEYALRIGGVRIASNVVFAPLSGISDAPFRRLVRSFGTELVYCEMVASGELLKDDRDSLQRTSTDGLGVHAVQLAGRDPAAMRSAAEIVAGLGAEIIDINMGCPAKKVVGGLSGSALMRDLDHALRLVDATLKGAGTVPVTLKMRLGWDRSSLNAPELAVRAEAAGIRLVTVHGRTRDQFYTGHADWPAIADVRRAVNIPVVANGDLVRKGDYEAMLRASGADAVMIGRGACGRPWFPALVAGSLKASSMRQRFVDVVLSHYDEMLSFYGSIAGVRHARKHLGWYLDRFEASSGERIADDRLRIMRAATADEVRSIVSRIFGDVRLADVEPEFDDPAFAA